MASKNDQPQQGISVSIVSNKEIILIFLAMAVVAGAAVAFALLG